MSSLRKFVLASLLTLSIFSCGCTPGAKPTIKKEPSKRTELEKKFISQELQLTDIYKSMRGPGLQDFFALDSSTSELAWLTGFSVDVVDSKSEEPIGQHYLCHSNLEIADSKRHYMAVTNRLFNPGRYFTISQGQRRAKLPEGFGIPIGTNHPINWNVQALNLNGVPEKPIGIREKVHVEYELDKNLKQPLQPLFAVSLVGLASVGDTPQNYCVTPQGAGTTGSGCLVSTSAVVDGVFTDAAGNKFTAHWVVKPGVEQASTLLDDIFTLPYDTTLHYAMLHVHAFCESVELYDLTDNKTVLSFECKQLPDKVGLLKTQEHTSIEGIPLYKDHSYELRSVYNNTSGVDQDAMVVLYVYLKDKSFKPPGK